MTSDLQYLQIMWKTENRCLDVNQLQLRKRLNIRTLLKQVSAASYESQWHSFSAKQTY